MPVNNQNSINTSYTQLFLMEMKIGDMPINPQNIVSLIIRESVVDIVPRLYCILNDDGYLSEIFNLQDNHNIEILLGRNPLDDNPIKTDFILINDKYNPISNFQASMISFSGLLNIKDFYTPIRNRSFFNKSSKDVLIDIALEGGMNAQTQANFITQDVMTWLQINQSNFHFTKHVLDRSYKQDDGVLGYYSIDKTFYLTSLKLEANKKNTIPARYNVENYHREAFDNNADKNSIWFNYFDYINLNGIYNKRNNYGVKTSWYDLLQTQSQEIKQNNALLSDLTFKNKDNINDISHKYINNYVNNVYDNYYIALAQNSYYKQNMFAFNLVLNINPLTSVKLMDTIDLIAPGMVKYGADMNEILTGKYLTMGQIYHVGKNSQLIKQLLLSRDGRNKSKNIQDSRIINE